MFSGFAYSLIQNLNKKFGDDSTREKRYVDEQLNRLEEENYRLRKQSNDTKATLADSTFNETQMRTQLRKAQTDVVRHQCCMATLVYYCHNKLKIRLYYLLF